MAESNGNCIIRTVKLEDAGAIVSIMNSVIAEGKYLITISDEYNKTPEEQRESIHNILKNERETILVAELNGEVVGYIVFFSQTRKRMSHKGSIGMMVDKNCRGIGIGKMLMEALLYWAETNPLIEKVSLGVFSSNHRAIKLYKNLGFIEEGRKINEFKMGENEYLDDILMYKLV
ncbi:GNAT family N-acetyltransferase [Virgibacillus ihumii]|uniref:GNAT family N-acetyltransferase n=1 Tax=Virgibacillus ihumii TaxID=2686091 RepID=UPI00157D34A8|nr:GNAT family N-acetyltransferase [Virgibacillus ihumii]